MHEIKRKRDEKLEAFRLAKLVAKSNGIASSTSSLAPKVKSTICIKPLYRNEAFLRQKYLVERLSARQIAVLISCSHNAINNAIIKFGLHKPRPRPGRPEYGFTIRKCRRVPHARQQNVIKWMRRRRALGWSYKRIAERLNRRGIRSPSGGQTWYHATVREILQPHRDRSQ